MSAINVAECQDMFKNIGRCEEKDNTMNGLYYPFTDKKCNFVHFNFYSNQSSIKTQWNK